LALALAVAFSPTGFAQGSLTPPPGAPAPTMKTLDQVESRTIVNATNTPGDATNTFIISKPGSYYLTGNITGASGKHGISVLANNVTLDLNGFALISGGGGSTRGVNTTTPIVNFCIRNGNVRGWAGGGVWAGAAVTLAEKLLLSDNVGEIYDDGTGLTVGNGSLVKDCVASGNRTGFYLPDRTQASNCIATINTDLGFYCTSYVSLIDCTSSRNGRTGIHTEDNCNIIRCSATRNLPSGYGIFTKSGSNVVDCTASNNGLDGIYVGGAGSTVRGCTVRGNEHNGVVAGGNAGHLIGNTCDANAESGILVTGDKNRLDGNSCTSNTTYGVFLVDGADRNLVIRNSAADGGFASTSGSGPDNAIGPIVRVTKGGSIFTASPWANFEY
jgi:parallel beta-helix repeat protein